MNGKINMLAASFERTILESALKVSHTPENHLNRPRDLDITSSKQPSIHEGKVLAGNSLECFMRTTFQSTDRFFWLNEDLFRVTSVYQHQNPRRRVGELRLLQKRINLEHSSEVWVMPQRIQAPH
jgi:hypothetical protein